MPGEERPQLVWRGDGTIIPLDGPDRETMERGLRLLARMIADAYRKDGASTRLSQAAGHVAGAKGGRVTGAGCHLPGGMGEEGRGRSSTLEQGTP